MCVNMYVFVRESVIIFVYVYTKLSPSVHVRVSPFPMVIQVREYLSTKSELK